MKPGKYRVKDGYKIKHDGKEFPGGAEIELTEEQAEKLHVESADEYKARMVLEGKDSYADSKQPVTKELVAKIEAAQHPETVEVLMSLSTVKAVATAGNKRLKELSEAIAAPEKDNGAITPESLAEKAKSAKNNDELVAIRKEAVDNLETSGIDFVSNAIAARLKELKG